jgi:hypothetical protein
MVWLSGSITVGRSVREHSVNRNKCLRCTGVTKDVPPSKLIRGARAPPRHSHLLLPDE